MTYLLGAQSRARLVGVHPDLVRVIAHAIQISEQDFGVGEGVRSDADQLRDWLRHASKLNGIPVGRTIDGIHGTGRGKHQESLADGLGHATDLVPYVDGVVLWSALPSDVPGNGEKQWGHICMMADAMRAAAIAEDVAIRWGAVWDRRLNDLPAGAINLLHARNAYAARHPGPDLLDGPHFELV